jgi:hypothetical protein
MMEDVSEKEWHTGPPALRPPGDPVPYAPSEPLPAPRAPLPAPIDPEAVRQFQQFQQFQELMRQQGDVPLLAPPRKPLWRKALGSKTVRKLVLLLIVVIGLYVAYQHYFGSSDDLPASETGGHTFTDRTMLQTRPNQSVRMVYQRVAENVPDVACGQFTNEAARQFAADFNEADCPAAVAALHAQVTGRKNDYAEPTFPSDLRDPPGNASVLEISSCRLDVVGGPKLGWFKVERTVRDQWIITQHRQETC